LQLLHLRPCHPLFPFRAAPLHPPLAARARPTERLGCARRRRRRRRHWHRPPPPRARPPPPAPPPLPPRTPCTPRRRARGPRRRVQWPASPAAGGRPPRHTTRDGPQRCSSGRRRAPPPRHSSHTCGCAGGRCTSTALRPGGGRR
jgi:hypothetical protein